MPFQKGHTGFRGKLQATHCPNGHEFTPENTYYEPKRPTARQCKTCRTARNRAYDWKARVTRRKAAGRCPACGAAKEIASAYSCLRCTEHALQNNLAHRRRRRKAGLCAYCENKVARGKSKVLCLEHLEKHRAKEADAKVQRALDSESCAYGDHELDEDSKRCGFVGCGECRERQAAYQEQYKKKQKRKAERAAAKVAEVAAAEKISNFFIGGL